MGEQRSGEYQVRVARKFRISQFDIRFNRVNLELFFHERQCMTINLDPKDFRFWPCVSEPANNPTVAYRKIDNPARTPVPQRLLTKILCSPPDVEIRLLAVIKHRVKRGDDPEL